MLGVRLLARNPLQPHPLRHLVHHRNLELLLSHPRQLSVRRLNLVPLGTRRRPHLGLHHSQVLSVNHQLLVRAVPSASPLPSAKRVLLGNLPILARTVFSASLPTRLRTAVLGNLLHLVANLLLASRVLSASLQPRVKGAPLANLPLANKLKGEQVHLADRE